MTEKFQKLTIDISGVDRNTFVILGFASKFAQDNPELIGDINAIVREMISGDYDNLVTVFKRHFSEFVDIV